MVTGFAQLPFITGPIQGEQFILSIVILGGWIASVCLHEFGHALIAYWGGDISVRDKGYLTLNPLKYTDLSLSIFLPLFFLAIGGLALPGAAVYINTHLLRNRVWRSAVSLAGPLATGLVALGLTLPFHLGWVTQDRWWWQALACLAFLQVTAFCFNLLPIPSFDGFGIVEPWLSPRLQQRARQWGRYGFLVIVGLMWAVPAAADLFWRLVRAVSVGFGVPLGYSLAGYELFRQSSLFLILIVVILALLGQRWQRRTTGTPQDQREDTNEADQASQTSAPTTAELQAWERELAAHNHAIQAGTQTADVWLGRAHLLGQLQRYDEAIQSYEQALKLDPNQPDAHRQRAVLLYRQGDYEAALSGYAVVIGGDQATAEDWYIYGTIQAQLDQYEAAIASYDQSLTLTSDRAAIWYDRGLALYWLDDCQSALDSFDRAVYLQPELQEAWFRRGLVLNRLQRYDRAIESFNQALSIQTDLPAVWAAKGLALLQLDQCEAAVTAHEKAVQLDPSDAHAWYNKACCHARLAEIQQAIESLDQAVQLNPEPTREVAIEDPDFEVLQADPAFQKLIYAG